MPWDFEATLWLWTPPPGPDGESLKELVFKALRKKMLSSLIMSLTLSNTEDDLVKDFPEVAAFTYRGKWEALLTVGVPFRVNAVLYED